MSSFEEFNACSTHAKETFEMPVKSMKRKRLLLPFFLLSFQSFAFVRVRVTKELPAFGSIDRMRATDYLAIVCADAFWQKNGLNYVHGACNSILLTWLLNRLIGSEFPSFRHSTQKFRLPLKSMNRCGPRHLLSHKLLNVVKSMKNC